MSARCPVCHSRPCYPGRPMCLVEWRRVTVEAQAAWFTARRKSEDNPSDIVAWSTLQDATRQVVALANEALLGDEERARP